MTVERLTFFVRGDPTPQGSMVAFRSPKNGRPIMRPSNANALRDWRKAVRRSALEAMESALPIKGPVRVYATFALHRPKSRRDPYPAGYPDLDKLDRAIRDALTGVVWDDDGQVVDSQTRKRWAGSTDALPWPGVRITVEPVVDALAGAQQAEQQAL